MIYKSTIMMLAAREQVALMSSSNSGARLLLYVYEQFAIPVVTTICKQQELLKVKDI